MRKKSIFENFLTASLVALLTASLVVVSSCEQDEDSNETTKEIRGDTYLIKYLPSEEAPEFAIVTGLNRKDTFSTASYSKCLNKAVRKINEKYVIRDVEGINDSYGESSITRTLYLVIEPRE